ncbi:uncharacterized protein LOC125007414 isoform X1 [Mugil cephalus]|uniref:uncharacterized protein LOC125007414 isoform X1 n=1 Tax=Mugil cephalus TaxID=48193 RepID=UPI001FB67C6A|nr:uncharacterized protein LOC125007414 isoform X1 [Mugil cephalus]
MKKLCVAVVVLSLVSVCRPAPLTCEKLVKPVDQGPDLTGRWYYIAFAGKVCLATTLINGLFWPSISEYIASMNTPNIYSSTMNIKIFDYCINETLFSFYEKNRMMDVDIDTGIPTGDPDVLLHTSCPDCIVVKSSDVIDSIFFLSRRKVITDAELKEFEMQAQCFGWSAPQAFNTDFDYGNCQNETDINDDDASDLHFFLKIYERLKSTGHSIIKCFTEVLLSYFSDLLATDS